MSSPVWSVQNQSLAGSVVGDIMVFYHWGLSTDEDWEEVVSMLGTSQPLAGVVVKVTNGASPTRRQRSIFMPYYRTQRPQVVLLTESRATRAGAALMSALGVSIRGFTTDQVREGLAWLGRPALSDEISALLAQ